MAPTKQDIIPWTSLRALSFDIYGTLIDWNAGMIVSSRETALGPCLHVSDENLFNGLFKHSTAVESKSPKMKKSDINAEGLVRYAHELGVVGEGEGKVIEEVATEAGKQHGAAIGVFPAFGDTVGFKKHCQT